MKTNILSEYERTHYFHSGMLHLQAISNSSKQAPKKKMYANVYY